MSDSTDSNNANMKDSGVHNDRKRLFGKYRGKVTDNADPLFLGRLQVEVSIPSPMILNWAMPCVPFPRPDGDLPVIPPIGTNVWIEFEAGDPNYPIWTGCFWTEGESPLLALT